MVFPVRHTAPGIRTAAANRLFICHKLRQSCAASAQGRAKVGAGRLLSMLALALLLVGCDKCGNWNLGVTLPAGLDACRNTVPQQ